MDQQQLTWRLLEMQSVSLPPDLLPQSLCGETQVSGVPQALQMFLLPAVVSEPLT